MAVSLFIPEHSLEISVAFLLTPIPRCNNFNLSAGLKGLPGAVGSTICPVTLCLGDGVSGEGCLKMRLSGAASENYFPSNSWLTCRWKKHLTQSQIPLCASPEQGSNMRMAEISLVWSLGFGKTDPVWVSQLALCGALTASPSWAGSLSFSHSLIVSGQPLVHSLLVSSSDCFCPCQTRLSTQKPQLVPETLFFLCYRSRAVILHWTGHSRRHSCSFAFRWGLWAQR